MPTPTPTPTPNPAAPSHLSDLPANSMGTILIADEDYGIASASIPPITSTRTLYVNGQAGNDSNDGLSLGQAKATINAATSIAIAGDLIEVADGDYFEEVTFAQSGTSNAPITLKGSGNTTIYGGDRLANWQVLSAIESTGLFYEGFENQNLTQFDSTTVTAPNTMAVQSSLAHQGQYGLITTFDGVQKSNRLNKNISPLMNEVYFRFYFQLSADFDILANDSRLDLLLLRETSSSATNQMRVSLQRNAGGSLYLKADIFNGGTIALYAGTPGEIIKGQWHAIEVRFIANSATVGGGQLWLDGNSLASNFAIDTLTDGYTVGRFELGVNSSSTTAPTANADIYFDNIKVNSSAIGAFNAMGTSNQYLHNSITWSPTVMSLGTSALASLGSFGALVSNSFYFNDGEDRIYLQSTSNPNSSITVAGRDTNAILVNKNHISIRNLKLRTANGSNGAGVLFTGATGGSVYGVQASHNRGSGVRCENSTGIQIAGNRFEENQRDFGAGVRVDTGGSGHQILSNYITSTFGSGVMAKGDSGNVTGLKVARNEIRTVVDSGIYMNDGITGATIEYNRIDDARVSGPTSGGNGIHMGDGAQNHIVRHNIISNVYTHGISAREGSNNNSIYNNISYKAGLKGSGNNFDLHGATTGSAGNSIYNNIAVSATTACYHADTLSVAAGGNLFDHNSCLNTVGSPFKWANTSYADVASFAAASGQGAGSVLADPQMTAPDTNDFRIWSESPVVGAGRP